MSDPVEDLARRFHEIYQAEAKRQGDVRHNDDYDQLSENIKEFDRVLAREVLADRERLSDADARLESVKQLAAQAVQAAEIRVAGLKAECERLRELLDAAQRESEDLRALLDVAQFECERLRARLHNCREDYHRKVIALQAEIAALKKEKRGHV